MTKFFIEIEKIARKWVTLKVQSKKDENKFYTGYTTKENLFQLDKNATVGTQMYVFADSKDTAEGFGHRYEFTLYTETSKEDIKGEEEYAYIVKVMQSYISYNSFCEVLSDFERTGNKLHEEETRDFYKKIKEQEIKKWYSYIVENYNDGKGYVYFNGVCKLHELGCHDYDDEIDEMERVVAKRKAEQEEKEMQERAKAKASAPKKFYNINKKIGEVFQDGNDCYKVIGIENFVTDSDGAVVTGKEERYANSIEFDLDNYEYHYNQEYIVEKISEDEYNAKSTKNDRFEDKREILEKIKNIEKTEISGEHHISEFTENAIILLDTFTIHGTGEMILVKNQNIYFINNNGMDGDMWDINNIKTGGAGAYGSQAILTKSLVAEINHYLELCEKKERVEYMQPEITVHLGGHDEKSLEEATKIIKDTLETIKTEFMQIGSILKQVRDEELYKQENFKNITEYAKKTFDMGKSQVYAYIKVYEMYGNDTRLKGYNFTQLRLLAENNKTVNEVLEFSTDITKKELTEKLKNVHLDGKEKFRLGGKVKNVSINDGESALLIKALELLHQQDTSIDINNLLKKLKEE